MITILVLILIVAHILGDFYLPLIPQHYNLTLLISS